MINFIQDEICFQKFLFNSTHFFILIKFIIFFIILIIILLTFIITLLNFPLKFTFICIKSFNFIILIMLFYDYNYQYCSYFNLKIYYILKLN